MYTETCLYTYISWGMPHNPVSHDAPHVFAERQTRGHNCSFQVPVNHHILHILHPRPRVAVSAMPESMANMPCTGSALRITSIPPAQITVQVWFELAVLSTLWQRFVGQAPPSTPQSVCTSLPDGSGPGVPGKRLGWGSGFHEGRGGQGGGAT